MAYWCVVPAAGLSARMRLGADHEQAQAASAAANTPPKPYRRIAAASVLEHSVRPFLSRDELQGIVVALRADDDHWASLSLSDEPSISTVVGGDTRAQSVANALAALDAAEDDWVLVHDGARPCLPPADLHNLINVLRDDAVGGILAAPISDTVKFCVGDRVRETIERGRAMRALTPQMFRYGLLRDALSDALARGEAPADEAEAVELAGGAVRVVVGSATNIKITYPDDLTLAESILNWQIARAAN